MSAQVDHWTRVPSLRGEHVALEPLRPAHAAGLRIALGDGELSRLWYTNVPGPKDIESHIAAALEMRRALDAVVQRMGARLPSPLALHVGVSTGPVVAGQVGALARSDYTGRMAVKH